MFTKNYFSLLLRSFTILFIIIMLLSVFFMAIFTIMPLEYKILGVFNCITVFVGFFIGILFFVKGIKHYSSCSHLVEILLAIAILTGSFALILVIFSYTWGGILMSIFTEKMIIALLGGIFGGIIAERLYKTY